jgi:hypothetical protein
MKKNEYTDAVAFTQKKQELEAEGHDLIPADGSDKRGPLRAFVDLTTETYYSIPVHIWGEAAHKGLIQVRQFPWIPPTMKDRVSPHDVVALLNGVLATDKEAITELLACRVPCNEALAKHLSIQVLADEEQYTVGLLGILNGLFGTFDRGTHRGWGPIAVRLSETDEIETFEEIHQD